MVEENHGVATLIIDEHLKKLAHEQSKPGKLQWFQRAVCPHEPLLQLQEGPGRRCPRRDCSMCPATRFKKTIDEYNAAAQGQTHGPVRQSRRQHAPATATGPYYAIDCSLGSKRHLCAVMTLGGLAVDEKTGQVLSENGGVVPGLYAAGRNAVGVCSRQYVSGLSIADCIYSGLRAARHATP